MLHLLCSELMFIWWGGLRITCVKLEMSAFLKFFVTVEVSCLSFSSLNNLLVDI